MVIPYSSIVFADSNQAGRAYLAKRSFYSMKCCDLNESAQFTEDTFFAKRNVISPADCTGLVPGAIQDEQEAIAYGELGAIHTPKPNKH